MTRARWLSMACLLGILLVWVATRFPGPGPEATEHHFSGRTMGTTYNVRLAQVTLSGARLDALEAQVQAELDRLEAAMSTYRESSEVSRFNAHASEQAFPVSPETLQVVRAAQLVSRQSRGAFDVSVRPLVAAWGFGAGAKLRPPTERELADARARVGFQHLSVDEASSSLTKSLPELEIDLSAIAKGYAVDRVVELLEAQGIENAMVEIGGEVRVLGEKAPEVPFRIGIEVPDSQRRASQRVVALGNLALATSGDYRNYYDDDGERRSHTIDPRTGRPITHRLASVSVLHPSAAMADGYATAINVLGPEAGLELARELGLAVYLILRKPDGAFESLSTPGFGRAREARAESSPFTEAGSSDSGHAHAD